MIGLAALVLACSEEKRYTMQSPEIETVKAVFERYNAGDLEGQKQYYADGAQIFNNVPESKPSTIDQVIEQQKSDSEGISSYNAEIQDDAIEMVVTDKGETWVNAWGVWTGTMAATNQTFEIPFHVTYRFVDGKIFREHGYWDNTNIVMAFMEYEAAQKASADTIPLDHQIVGLKGQ